MWAGGGWGVALWRILSQNRWGSEGDQTAVHTHLPGRPGGGPPGPGGMEHPPPPNLLPGLCQAHPSPEMGARFCASAPPFSRAMSPACRECPGEQQKPGAPPPPGGPAPTRPPDQKIGGRVGPCPGGGRGHAGALRPPAVSPEPPNPASGNEGPHTPGRGAPRTFASHCGPWNLEPLHPIPPRRLGRGH